MIYVKRQRKDEDGKPISPSKKWLKKAKERTKVAMREKASHEWDAAVYSDAREIRPVLEELFHGKCAYCEEELSSGWDVEHFRPKGKVAEREKDHPGYYWLGYKWENLYPSCKPCNQRRRDKPIWGDLRELPSAGKSYQFPLLDESTRAMSKKDDICEEHTLLIDPCYDDPEWYFGYDTEGQILALEGNPYGEKSINVFNLNRRRLVRRRRRRIIRVARLLALVSKWEEEGEEEVARDFRGVLQDFTADESKYAGAARFIEAGDKSL